MLCDSGTNGISHEVHVAKETDDGLGEFTKYDNVLDAINLPNGQVKFYYENEQTIIKSGRIVRTKVKGVDDAFRYRCTECLTYNSDIISQQDRGESFYMECSVCEKRSEHKRMELDEL